MTLSIPCPSQMLIRSLLKSLKLLILSIICWQLTLSPGFAAIQSKYYSYRQPSFDGTGKFYMGREIAQVMGYQGAKWLERADRAQEEQPQKMVVAMALQPTDIVADLGAGTGYISQLLARQVPQGKVLAIDFQPEMVKMLRENVTQAKITNIEPRLATENSPELPANSIDVALMVDAYHEFSYPQEMMTGIMAALKPGGRVVLAEYRGEDPLVFIKPHHKTTQKQIRRELEAIGLTWQKTDKLLPQQHLLFFTKN